MRRRYAMIFADAMPRDIALLLSARYVMLPRQRSRAAAAGAMMP